MNCFQVIILSFFILSCASKQNSVTNYKGIISTKKCPDDGICTLEIIPNQSLKIEKDGIGSLYPKISKGDKTLIKFEYKRNEIPNTVDGNYSEIIFLELDSNKLETELENYNLKNAKALFARLCFCRGQTGYYPLSNGKLSIKKLDKKEYHLKFSFKVKEVPQLVTIIDEVFTLK